MVKVLVVLLWSIVVLVSSCDPSMPPQEGGSEQTPSELPLSEQRNVDPEGRPFNPSLSCVGHCTGFVESGPERCFCDAVCEQNKNCCADFKTACAFPLPSEPDPNLQSAPEQLNPPDPTGLTRNYPDFVKCSWISSPELPVVVQNTEELRQLGLNTVCIMEEIDQFNSRIDRQESEAMKPRTLSSIAALKRAGFAIVLVMDVGGGPGGQDIYTKLTVEQYLGVVEEEALVWAKLAEEYRVEYFAPANELPSPLHNLFSTYPESERQQRKIEKSNEWHKYILPKVRELFNGKVIAKLGDYTPGLDPQGYDVVAYTMGHNFFTDLDQFRREKVKSTYDISIKQAQENNAEWWVGEIWFAYEDAFSGTDSPPEYTTKRDQLRELQDDYHRIVIEEIDALPPEQKPKALVVGGYAPGSMYPTLTEESKEVIQNFFTRGDLQ